MCVSLASLVVFILDRTFRRCFAFVGFCTLLDVREVHILVNEVGMLGCEHSFGFDATRARIQEGRWRLQVVLACWLGLELHLHG